MREEGEGNETETEEECKTNSEISFRVNILLLLHQACHTATVAPVPASASTAAHELPPDPSCFFLFFIFNVARNFLHIAVPA